ncbi:MAG: KamA family radical SAM protein [Lentisphaerae bacterium]|nr:KamA family radical SAM protein [Lentisphaerota bacterium]
MTTSYHLKQFSASYFRKQLPEIVKLAHECFSAEDFRLGLLQLCDRQEFASASLPDGKSISHAIRIRDCARNLRSMLAPRAEKLAGFSFAKSIYCIGRHKEAENLSADFYADATHLLLGLLDRSAWSSLTELQCEENQAQGRQAAVQRSTQMDQLSESVDAQMRRFAHGLQEDVVARRQERRKHICRQLGASQEQFDDWRWQFDNIQQNPEQIAKLVKLSETERNSIRDACKQCLPFGVTPYYLSLMDDRPELGFDRAIRAQVFPGERYVEGMQNCSEDRAAYDFMHEGDTSPIDLVTRRYPAICIFKPFNTCPQICVYCQRNWEIDDAMAADAMASPEKVQAALDWIAAHPAIHEVLITGGDPLAMNNQDFYEILKGVANIPSIERIRIGSRVLATAPMRIDDELIAMLSEFRQPGRRQIALVTHFEHAYEVTPEVISAVERLRQAGISIFNQQVYTFFVSRRFEAALLRRTLARAGIEPYYTFNAKGKEETSDYRVPLARLLQEQKEEARLLPGLSRTDEGVYNVPGMGKNYLRASQHRSLVSILPNGVRLYEFHPWEKNITQVSAGYIGEDVPLLDYLQRLEKNGENPEDYDSLWYYF